jgi:hypothetical protein
VAVDAEGDVYFTGATTSRNFPMTEGAVQPARRRERDAIAVALKADFSRLLYSTHLGGSGAEYGRVAAADPRRAFLFAGETDSPDWPVGSRPSNAGFAAKLVLPWVTAGR